MGCLIDGLMVGAERVAGAASGRRMLKREVATMVSQRFDVDLSHMVNMEVGLCASSRRRVC